jgi:hypothetical protein
MTQDRQDTVVKFHKSTQRKHTEPLTSVFLVPLLILQMGWTKEETDYLLDMLEQFDLRFVVVADRYNVRAGMVGGRHLADGQASC